MKSELINQYCYFVLDLLDCIEKVVKNALFMFGTIGGNDYNYALFEGKPMEELTSMVPEVVNAIMVGVRVSLIN